MRLTIRLLGTEVLHVTTDCDEDNAPGDCTTYPIGFVARMEKPHEVDTPDRDW